MDSKKKIRMTIGAGLATLAIATGIGIGVPAFAQSVNPSPRTAAAHVGAADGETADDQGVEDGTNDGETADD